MKVTLKSIGDLRDYFGRPPRLVELPDAATAGDLLHWIDNEYAARLPAYLWDSQKHTFRGPVLLVIDKKAVLDMGTPLVDGGEVYIMKALAGG
jgi:hypothetical protein